MGGALTILTVLCSIFVFCHYFISRLCTIYVYADDVLVILYIYFPAMYVAFVPFCFIIK